MVNFSGGNIFLIILTAIMFIVAAIVTWKTSPLFEYERNLIEKIFMWLFWFLFLICLTFTLLLVFEII